MSYKICKQTDQRIMLQDTGGFLISSLVFFLPRLGQGLSI